MKKFIEFIENDYYVIAIIIIIFLALAINTNAQIYTSGDVDILKGNEKSTYSTIETGLFIGAISEVVKDTFMFSKYSSSGWSANINILARQISEYGSGLIYGGSVGVNKSNINIPNKFNKSITNYSFQGIIGLGDRNIYGAIIFGGFIPDTKVNLIVYNIGFNGRFQTELIQEQIAIGFDMQFGFKTNNQFFGTGTDLYGIMGLNIVKIFKL